LALTLLVAHAAEVGAIEPCERIAPNKRVRFDFKEAPLREVADWISCARGLNIIFQPKTLATVSVTFIASTPVKVRELGRLFRAMLRLEGLRMRKTGAYYLIDRARK
jgi:type II secretory pathway component GspD/PulD (secretin)